MSTLLPIINIEFGNENSNETWFSFSNLRREKEEFFYVRMVMEPGN